MPDLTAPRHDHPVMTAPRQVRHIYYVAIAVGMSGFTILLFNRPLAISSCDDKGKSDWTRSAGQIMRRVGLIYPAAGQIDTAKAKT